MLWDRRPVDWLDFCCYCHDIGYDTHDQAKLLKADLAFLDCLEKTRMTTERGGVSAAVLYRAMCTTGTSTNLITFVLSVITIWHAYVDLSQSLDQSDHQKLFRYGTYFDDDSITNMLT